MAIWHRESGSRAASCDRLGAVFQHSLIVIKISVLMPYWQDRNAQKLKIAVYYSIYRLGNAAKEKYDSLVEMNILLRLTLALTLALTLSLTLALILALILALMLALMLALTLTLYILINLT